jgi:hypothetical protein
MLAARREVEFVDMTATRDGETLYAEAKGRTSSVGLDVDTMYGLLLRRMRDESGAARYAVVVSSEAVTAASCAGMGSRSSRGLRVRDREGRCGDAAPLIGLIGDGAYARCP